MIKFRDEGMFQPVDELLGNQDSGHGLPVIIRKLKRRRNVSGTDIKYIPNKVPVLEPSKTFRQHHTFREIKLGTAEFNKISESDSE